MSSDTASLPADPLWPCPETPLPMLAAITVDVGIGAGLGGMLPALLPHGPQHFAYGYSMHVLIGSRSFLQDVTAPTPARRLCIHRFEGAAARATAGRD